MAVAAPRTPPNSPAWIPPRRWQDRFAEGRMGRRRCGRCLRRSGAPDTVGGRRCCRGPTPDPARCPPWGILWPGFSKHARVEARSKGNFLCSQPRASSRREGCRERRLWALPRPSRPAGRSSFPYRPAGRLSIQGANRVAPGGRGGKETPLPLLPAWRSSAPSDVLARYQDFGNPD